MGREFELKFSCTEEAFASLQADFTDFTPIEMETTYYDTFDGRLGNNRWTLRRRYENGKSICTLKTPCPDGGRGEWEVECPSIMAAIPQLVKLGAPMDLMAFCVSGVSAVCGAKFTRLAKTLEIPGATVELALDQGKLLGNNREMPLLEVEVELKEGNDEAAITFARELAVKYGLKGENRSKYRRALGLARGEFDV
jgi:inorganic triphosphatase YgiF